MGQSGCRKEYVTHALQQNIFLFKAEDMKNLLTRTEVEELTLKCKEASFLTAISSITVLRYLSDNSHSLAMGTISRLLCSNDVIMALISLVHTPPWVRAQKGKVTGTTLLLSLTDENHRPVRTSMSRSTSCRTLQPQFDIRGVQVHT